MQRDQPIKIWGWAEPKEKITLVFNKKTFKTTTSDNGKWELKLPAQSAGTGFEMILKGKNEISIKKYSIWRRLALQRSKQYGNAHGKSKRKIS